MVKQVNQLTFSRKLVLLVVAILSIAVQAVAPALEILLVIEYYLEFCTELFIEFVNLLSVNIPLLNFFNNNGINSNT